MAKCTSVSHLRPAPKLTHNRCSKASSSSQKAYKSHAISAPRKSIKPSFQRAKRATKSASQKAHRGSTPTDLLLVANPDDDVFAPTSTSTNTSQQLKTLPANNLLAAVAEHQHHASTTSSAIARPSKQRHGVGALSAEQKHLMEANVQWRRERVSPSPESRWCRDGMVQRRIRAKERRVKLLSIGLSRGWSGGSGRL